MIYLARHGQTEANLNHLWQGQSGDDLLNQTGKLQAKKLAEYFGDKEIKHIFASPLKRAHETAEIVAETLNLKVEIDDLLMEMNYGDFEGMTMFEIEDSEYGELYHKWRTDPQGTKFPDGESFEDLLARAQKIIEKYFYAEENILLVSHEDMIRGIIVTASGRPNEFWMPAIANTSVTTFKDVGDKIETIVVGQTPDVEVY